MPRYLLLSRHPKTGQALDVARTAPGLQLDGVVDADHVLVQGQETVVAALLATHSECVDIERIVEISWYPDESPTSKSSPPLPPTSFPGLPEPSEPPLPSSFRFA